MDSSGKIPCFSYDISSTAQKNSSCVVAEYSVYERILDADEFYRELGYSKSISGRGILPEEYINYVYMRDNAAKSAQCLQIKISRYLFKHSKRFRNEYGAKFGNLIGKCSSDEMDDSATCSACPMHPGTQGGG